MSIQPLVENACKHGIQAVEGKGIIRISARLDEGRLRVVVSDNGKGMGSDHLEQIKASMRSESVTDNSIGIRNVYRRLELYYDDLVRFDMTSIPDLGTQVLFEIPVKYLKRYNQEQEEAT